MWSRRWTQCPTWLGWKQHRLVVEVESTATLLRHFSADVESSSKNCIKSILINKSQNCSSFISSNNTFLLPYSEVYFYAYLPLQNGAGGIQHSGLSVCEWVRESVRPENIVYTISQKLMKGISPILVRDVFGFVNVLIRFWG